MSLLCGVCLAGANFVKMHAGGPAAAGQRRRDAYRCALVVCLTILFVVVFAKMRGLLPAHRWPRRSAWTRR